MAQFEIVKLITIFDASLTVALGKEGRNEVGKEGLYEIHMFYPVLCKQLENK